MSGNINFNGWLNDDGSENYKCRAWVNFNGTGTVAIRAAGNVSSITDTATGRYTVNFTNAMVDADYGVAATCRNTSVGNIFIEAPQTVISTTAVDCDTIARATGALTDVQYCFITIFR